MAIKQNIGQISGGQRRKAFNFEIEKVLFQATLNNEFRGKFTKNTENYNK